MDEKHSRQLYVHLVIIGDLVALGDNAVWTTLATRHSPTFLFKFCKEIALFLAFSMSAIYVSFPFHMPGFENCHSSVGFELRSRRACVPVCEVPGGAAYGYVFSWEGVAV